METPIELFDYIIHEGIIDGRTYYGLLWPGSDWKYKANPSIEVVVRPNGYRDCVIESEEGIAILKSLDSNLSGKVAESGLLVIWKVASGKVFQINIPPRRASDDSKR